MWSVNQPPARIRRTDSFHSVTSERSSNASSEDLTSHMSAGPNVAAMWGSAPRAPTNVSRLSQKFGRANISVIEFSPAPAPREQNKPSPEVDDDVRSRSSTLGGDENDYEYPEKTPTPDSMPQKLIDHVEQDVTNAKVEVDAGSRPTHVAGPLELQLQALMSKLVFMERENPTVAVTPEDYAEMQLRLSALEEEKKAWHQRHEALFALRDEDVSNIIKVRGLLAKACWDLEGMTKLRDDDLVNLQVVRGKLAEATRKLERFEAQSPVNGRSTPSRGRPSSIMLERRDTADLFAAAKASALEQRVIELEKRNSDLLTQIEALKSGAQATAAAKEIPKDDARVDNVNRVAAHKAWKDTVAEMEGKLRAKDAEIAILRASGASSAPHAQSSGVAWHRVEALHEEHATYREKVGGKMQLLRLEKEMLQKELHRKEDECHDLEVKVQSLQRKLNVA